MHIYSASQMWMLGRLLPSMVGKYIPEGDKHWENYLLVLEIVDYLLAPDILREEVAHLKSIIECHHAAFVSLYPDATVIPKMHYMVHMPRLILRYKLY